MIKEELSRVLKEARQQAGFTQGELAKKTGLSQANVSHIENNTGDRAVGIHVAEKWLLACGVNHVEIIAKFQVGS